jgi:hypothetical protein
VNETPLVGRLRRIGSAGSFAGANLFGGVAGVDDQIAACSAVDQRDSAQVGDHVPAGTAEQRTHATAQHQGEAGDDVVAATAVGKTLRAQEFDGVRT